MELKSLKENSTDSSGKKIGSEEKKAREKLLVKELGESKRKTCCQYGAKCEHIHLDSSSMLKLANMRETTGLNQQIQYVLDREPYVQSPEYPNKRKAEQADIGSEEDSPAGGAASGSAAKASKEG